MNWRVKALLQLAFSATPGGDRLNYVFQRYVTKSMPPDDISFRASVSFARRHFDVVQRHYDGSLKDGTFYEFGAGWELAIPLTFYALGVDRQIVVDIRSLARPELINDTIEKFGTLLRDSEVPRRPVRRLPPGRRAFHASLNEHYGIDYRAPCDARRTGLPTGSIDCITSTTTMEHIPPADTQSILRECHRILRDGGLASFLIDYLDHYSYFDPNISNYNYLRYSDTAWAFFNPGLHYQNRLRHSDYMTFLEAAGFEIVDEQRRDATDPELRVIEGLPIADRFRSYRPDDLAVRQALIVVRKTKH